VPDTAALFALIEADDADGLTAALAGAPEGHRLRNAAGESLLQFATYRGRARCAEALARRGPLSLHEAALVGDAARLDELLDAAPWAIDLLSPDGWTALHLAAFFGRDGVVLRLLQRGADALVWSRAFETNLAIHAACAGKRIGTAAFARLVTATGDPDAAPNHGYTALMEAAMNGFAAAVEVLLAAGADKTRRHPEKDMAAAEFAAANGHAALAERLRG
jgi:ankyrin repeat protein